MMVKLMNVDLQKCQVLKKEKHTYIQLNQISGFPNQEQGLLLYENAEIVG
jgi:hypothetical protein